MSLLFGDNVLPTCSYSRAVDDDDDDDMSQFLPRKQLRFEWRVESSQSIPCTSMVIAVGPVATGYVEAYVLSCEPHVELGVFCGADEMREDSLEESHGLKRKSQWNGSINSLTNHAGVIVVSCPIPLEPELSHDWMKQVSSVFDMRSSRITVLTASGWGEYKNSWSSSDRPERLMRCLKSSACADTLPSPLLEQPNMISGLAAEVLTHCEINRIPCLLLVCYCNTAHIDGDVLRAFHKVLSATDLKNIAKETEKTKECIASVTKLHSKDLPLFM